MSEFLVVCEGIYVVVLMAGGVLLSSTATWVGLRWMLSGPNPRLGWFETLLPVRGRWVRYLLTPPFLLVAWGAVWFTTINLWQVPAPFALAIFLAGDTLAALCKHRHNQRCSG